MKAAVLRFRTTENPGEGKDRCAGWQPWIIENAEEPILRAGFDVSTRTSSLAISGGVKKRPRIAPGASADG
jgi:hypothetical protein